MTQEQGRSKSNALVGFVFWGACAAAMFVLVVHLHKSGKFAEWYYYTANAKGYAINADNFRDATKDKPAYLKIGKFDKIEGLQAVPVDKGSRLPENCNGVIMIGDLVDDKRARFEDTSVVVKAPIDSLDKEYKRIKAEMKEEIKEKKKGAAKDGYSINIDETKNASPQNPVYFEVGKFTKLNGPQAVEVKKGDVEPEGASGIIGVNMATEGSQALLEGNRIKVTAPLSLNEDEGGYAVVGSSLEGASEGSPVTLEVTRKRNIQPNQAFPIKKGDILPLNVTAIIKKEVVVEGSVASLTPDKQLTVLVPWEIKDAKGFKFKDTFKHKGIKTYPVAAIWNVLIVFGLGISLGFMAEFFTDVLGIKVEKIHHFEGAH